MPVDRVVLPEPREIGEWIVKLYGVLQEEIRERITAHDTGHISPHAAHVKTASLCVRTCAVTRFIRSLPAKRERAAVGWSAAAGLVASLEVNPVDRSSEVPFFSRRGARRAEIGRA